MIKSWLIGLLMLFVVPAWGLSEARLLRQSKSGDTALFNLGRFDGVKEGDYAVIVKEIRSLDQRDLRLVPVARARNIKINTDSSVWILYRVLERELLVNGDRFLVLSESEMLRGRRDPRFGRVTVVAPPGEENAALKSNLADDQRRMVKLKDKYQEGSILKEKQSLKNTDGTLIDLENWEKLKGERYRVALYKSPHQEEFRRQLRLATFEKLVTNYLRKVNDPEFNYDSFYDEQMRDQAFNEFRRRSYFETEYRSYMKDKAPKASLNSQLHRKMLEKGESWSEDLSDEELAQTLHGVSVLQEKDRRDYIGSKATRYSVNVDYAFNINDPQTGSDPYRRENRTSLEGIFEVTPFLKHITLERFTLWGSVRRNQTAFEANSFNANVDEVSMALGANWYPLYAPHIIQAPVIYLGTFVRTGYATVKAPTPSDKSNYTVLAAPGLAGGLKYIFRNRFGLRINGTMETLNLDRYKADRTGSILPDSTKFLDAKVGFGLAYFF